MRISADQLRAFAEAYSYADDVGVIEAGRRARKRGLYTFDEFLSICHWKSPRSQPRCRRNSAIEVEEATRFALQAKTERLRIESLRCLSGVDWPTASVLLHLAHTDPYPVLDFRALWSLGMPQPASYSLHGWLEYVAICRSLADRHRLSMRQLDRALWQYSKENQRGA